MKINRIWFVFVNVKENKKIDLIWIYLEKKKKFKIFIKIKKKWIILIFNNNRILHEWHTNNKMKINKE